MKTFRFFLLVFAALFLGVNFTACEDEEETEILNDSNEPESVIDESVEDTLPREKRLTEMKIAKNNLTDDPNFKPSSSTYKFSYDNMGRLILCEIINSKGVTTSTEIYSWKENSIVCEIMEKDGNDKLITFQLENNLISNLNSKYKNNEENYIQEFSFAYDSMNHLVKQHKNMVRKILQPIITSGETIKFKKSLLKIILIGISQIIPIVRKLLMGTFQYLLL